jgi:hypothetical protein
MVFLEPVGLYGRDAQCRRIDEMLEDGRGGTLCVDGPPGSGRTRLLRYAAATAASRPAGGPTLVVVDVDDSSIRPQPDPDHVVWAVARPPRPGDPRPVHVELGPLPEAAVAELVTELIGEPPTPALLGLVAGAGGNPVLIVALVSVLRAEGRLGAVPADLPARVGALVAERLDGLSPQCRDLLPVALSETERAIAGLVHKGLTNGQIARRVHLSPHTVNYHLRRIFR